MAINETTGRDHLPSAPTVVSFEWAMKELLRDEANFDVWEGFLGALLKEEIRVINLLEPPAVQAGGDASNRIDLLVQDRQAVPFIIIVQHCYDIRFLYRLPSQSAQVAMNNLNDRQRPRSIKKVITVSLLHFLLNEAGEMNDYVYHSVTQFHGMHGGQHPSPEQKVFPEYYLIEIQRFPDEIKTPLDEWIYFFKHGAIPAEFQANQMQTARRKLDLMNLSDEARRDYEQFVLTQAIARIS